MRNTKTITPFIWVRLGDADNYNRFDDVADAAEHMALFGVKHVYRSRRFGVEAQGLTGQNYISLYFGDTDAQPTGELLDRDIHDLNVYLRKEERR